MTPKGPIVAIDHVYYRTRDMDRAVAFYETILGLAVSSRAGNEWAEFRAEGVRLALHGTEEASTPPSGTVVFRVEDLDEARWALQQRGVVFDGHESEVPGVARFTTFHDPDGNLLQLIEYGPREHLRAQAPADPSRGWLQGVRGLATLLWPVRLPSPGPGARTR